MLIVIAIIYFGIKLIGEAIEDSQMKEWSKQQGFDTYASSTGLKDIKTGKHCYIDPITKKKTLW